MNNMIASYLDKTFPNIEVKIPRSSVDIDIYNKIFETPLFSVYFYNYSNVNNYISFCFDHQNFPILNIKSFLKSKTRFNYNIINEDGIEKIIFETDGCIPYRWLDIIKDFLNDKIEYSIKNTIDHTELINSIPEPVLDRIITISKNHKTYHFSVNKASEYDNSDKWYTRDGNHSEPTKYILKQCNNFLSTKQSKYKGLDCYKVLYACEGGIEIFNDYIDEYIKFSHVNFSNGSIRNECKGVNRYRTGKDVNPEELMVLYLCLKKLGCKLSEFLSY